MLPSSASSDFYEVTADKAGDDDDDGWTGGGGRDAAAVSPATTTTAAATAAARNPPPASAQVYRRLLREGRHLRDANRDLRASIDRNTARHAALQRCVVRHAELTACLGLGAVPEAAAAKRRMRAEAGFEAESRTEVRRSAVQARLRRLRPCLLQRRPHPEPCGGRSAVSAAAAAAAPTPLWERRVPPRLAEVKEELRERDEGLLLSRDALRGMVYRLTEADAEARRVRRDALLGCGGNAAAAAAAAAAASAAAASPVDAEAVEAMVARLASPKTAFVEEGGGGGGGDAAWPVLSEDEAAELVRRLAVPGSRAVSAGGSSASGWEPVFPLHKKHPALTKPRMAGHLQRIVKATAASAAGRYRAQAGKGVSTCT